MGLHYDIAEFERRMREGYRAQIGTAKNEFERLQVIGGEVIVQFGVFGAKMDNDGVNDAMQMQVQAAIIASLIENLARDFGDPEEMVPAVLQIVTAYAMRGGEVMGITVAPVIAGGRA